MTQSRIIITDAEMQSVVSATRVEILKNHRRGEAPWAYLNPGHRMWVAESFTVTRAGEGTYKVDGKPWAIDPTGHPVLLRPGKRANFSMPECLARFEVEFVTADLIVPEDARYDAKVRLICEVRPT